MAHLSKNVLFFTTLPYCVKLQQPNYIFKLKILQHTKWALKWSACHTHGIKSLTIPLFILSLAPHLIIFSKKVITMTPHNWGVVMGGHSYNLFRKNDSLRSYTQNDKWYG